MTKKSFITVFILLIFSFCIFATDSLVERYLTEANNQFEAGNFEKSYKYVNQAIDLFSVEEIPANVAIIAEPIYLEYLKMIHEKLDDDAFAQFKSRIKDVPNIVSSRIKREVASFENALEKKANEQAINVQTEQNTEVMKQFADTLTQQQEQYQKQQEEDRKAQAEQSSKILDAIGSQSEQFRSVMEENASQTKQTNESLIFVLLILVGVIVLVFIIVIISIIISSKNTKKQQEQFAATLEMVARMNRIPSERLMLGNVTDIYGDGNLRYAGSTRIGGKEALPEPELSDEEKQEVHDLAVRCEEVGNEIDVMTGRKNNSKNISEMVYKIALNLGLGQNTVMLYFCASMVYDIGFLSLEKDLLQAESLTDEEKYLIRSHVKVDQGVFDFVPERYIQIFMDAAATHHENMDGTGYPSGLKGTEIPQIAKIIHVVETFISLISRRSYREIFDKESAVQELKNHPELYDKEIVEILDSIV
ncbi:MAG: hypothetical protein E7062_08930 [Spirochaetaceae bacterium]|nr:hypothetical protein [Spirochaetaceae bacterium]